MGTLERSLGQVDLARTRIHERPGRTYPMTPVTSSGCHDGNYFTSGSHGRLFAGASSDR